MQIRPRSWSNLRRSIAPRSGGGWQLGIRAKLFLLSVALITVALGGATWYVSRALEHDLEQRARADLRVTIDLAAAAVRRADAFEPAAADAVLREIAGTTRARLTLIAPDGHVAADSAVSLDHVATLENHNARPEVRAARATGFGTDDRESRTLRESLFYVARRLQRPDDGSLWVIRVAAAPQLMDAARIATRRQSLFGALFGLATAAALTALTAQLVSRPLRSLTSTARAMLQDLSVRTRVRAGDEIGALAGALDELANGLTASVNSLQHQRDQLGAILESMAEGVLVTDTDGRIVVANRALRETMLVGRDVLGQSPIEAIRNAELHELIDEAARTEGPVSREVAIGGVRPRRVLVRATPLGDGAHGVVTVLSDVTELRRLETIRRDFVANVSHELRTPIAAVQAAVETLREGAIDHPAAAREFVSIIDRHGTRLYQLVEDLLELSRIEAKELKLSLEPLVIGDAIAAAAELQQVAADKRRARIVTQVTPHTPLVNADRRALGHVLSNLIDNAIKYSPEGATVTVRATPRDGGVRVAVQDTGVGIEAKHLPRVFERFYRVDPGRSRQLGGTGLGLAIVKHLAEAMDATVSVESAIGRGSTFYVDLRAAVATPAPAPARARDAEA